MKVAKLVNADLMVRVIVDENATDDDIIKASRAKFIELCDSKSLGDNVVGWEDDDECPATKEEQVT